MGETQTLAVIWIPEITTVFYWHYVVYLLSHLVAPGRAMLQVDTLPTVPVKNRLTKRLPSAGTVKILVRVIPLVSLVGVLSAASSVNCELVTERLLTHLYYRH